MGQTKSTKYGEQSLHFVLFGLFTYTVVRALLFFPFLKFTTIFFMGIKLLNVRENLSGKTFNSMFGRKVMFHVELANHISIIKIDN